tara:strand:+ start:450 stop:1334 length:885 start_codon:yes stop_codon:yes gene_type:complete
MPPELDEANIDVGDSEENATEINLSPESEPVSEPEPEIKVSASTDELEEYSSNVKGRINDLTKRFREEERQKQTAIEFAESVRKENENLKTRLNNLDKGYIEQFEGRVDSQLESAKKALKEAHEVGDVDKIVDAQEALSQLSLERSRVNVAKAPQPEPAQAPVAPATPQPQQPQQPVKADPKAEAWAQKNEWFGEDEVMTYAAFGVHRRLIEDEGFDPTSNDYYDELDKRMRNEFPQKFESSPKSNGGRKVASAESSKSRNRSGRKTVRLTASQVAIAKRLNVPLEEYAKHVRN